jgi:pyruvate kinase
MERLGIRRPVIAKIEKMEAVRDLDRILEVVEGIMVARGDLGVEVPIEEVPILQKRVIRRCNLAGKPVITATQMLESMVGNPRPTRAEVTDVANAILDGTDAVMLSGETAAGAYPVESCRMMAKVAANADPFLPDRAAFGRAGDVTEAVAQAAVEMARSVRASAILCATTTGGTARLTAKYRPDTPVVATTPYPETFRRLALTWGVRPLLIEKVSDTDEMMEKSLNAIIERGMVRTGDRVILTAGIPLYVTGNTNLIIVHVVGQPLRPGAVD